MTSIWDYDSQDVYGGVAPVDPITEFTTNRDHANRGSFNSVFGDKIVALRRDDINITFQYNNSTLAVKETISGGGSTGNDSSMGYVTVDASEGSAELQSLNPIRYIAGHEAVAFFTAVFEEPQIGINQYIGALNTENGAAFGTNDGVFGVWFISDSIETFTPMSEWNGKSLPKDFELDISNMNLFSVSYGYLGIAPIIFHIYCGLKYGWIAVHSIDLANKQAEPHLKNPTLPISMRIVRTTVEGAEPSTSTIRTASWNGCAIASDQTYASSDRWFSFTSLDFAPTGTFVRNNVFTISNPTTFQGKTNHVDVELAVVAFDNSASKTIAFYGVKNGTLSGNSAYANIDADNSVISVSEGGTVADGYIATSTVLKKDGSIRIDVNKTGLIIHPGETWTVEAQASDAINGTISVALRWIEKF